MAVSAPISDELHSAWQAVRRELESSLPPTTFDLWLAPLRLVSAQGPTLYLSAPERVRNWVERRYATQLIAALKHHLPDVESIGFIDAGGSEPAAPAGAHSPRSLPIDEGHTFERFVIGPGNRLGHASALAVAELPGEAYNPLFLHGPPGLGKTHLLGAIANYMRDHHAGMTVHYTTAERFTNEFVTALRHSGPDAFKARYRELDALLIDDVQFLEGKEATEEEFFHTFNALHVAGKQIVLCADRPPSALSRLAERLRDRFDWGLTVELEAPDVRTRMALLWRLASGSQVELAEPTALREIAARVPGNVRLLEGAMTRVLALSSLLSEPLSTPLVRRALDPKGEPPAPAESRAPSLGAIQDAVCAVHGVSRADLASSARSTRIVQARQLAMYLARELTPLSLNQIAREFDRDHTTVLHAVRTVAQRLEPGSETSAAVHRIRLELGAGGRAAGESSQPGDHPHP